MTATAGPRFGPERYRALVSGLQEIVTGGPARTDGPGRSTVLVQAEAIVALEAAAHGVGTTLARAGAAAVSVESSRYGRVFSDWLARAGARVLRIPLPDGEPLDPGHLGDVLAANPEVRAVALTHGEALTGVLHPLAAVARTAHAAGACVVLDAVATIGAAEPPREADLTVIGLQKALGGGFGLSAVTLTAAGRALLTGQDPTAPSMLSLPYLARLQEECLAAGALPGEPSRSELAIAEGALDGLSAEGASARRARHRQTAAALRAALRGAGLEPLVRADAAANPLATTVLLPHGVQTEAVLTTTTALGARWAEGGTTPRGTYLRVSHYAAGATFERALTDAVALAHALRAHGSDPGAAARAALAAWQGAVP